MKLCAPLILALFAGLAVAGGDDTKKLQGKWVATSMRWEGKDLSPEQVKKGNISLVIQGDRFVFITPKETQRGTIKIDGAKSPKTFDLDVTRGDGSKKTIRGIYQWEGDLLRMAGQPDERPPNFDSTASEAMVVKLKRTGDD